MTGFNISSQPIYDPQAVQPMRDELVAVGIKELLTPEDVDAALAEKGATLIIINSVCGCAAGNARPGSMLALQNEKIPDQLCTVFAGQDRAATEQARGRMTGIPPSSPCIALFKNSEVVFCLQRLQIENMTALQVATELAKAFNEHCTAAGPSIPEADLLKIPVFQGCGSQIPEFRPG